VTSSLLPSLRELANLAEIRGAAAEAADLRRAVRAISALGPEGELRAANLARRDKLGEFPGLVPAVRWRIREVVASAHSAVDAARRGVPSLLRDLLDLAAIPSADALALAHELDVVTRADLALALDDGRIAARFGDAGETSLCAALQATTADEATMTLGRAWTVLDGFLEAIAPLGNLLEEICPAGDVRRCEPMVRSLVVVGRAVDRTAAVEAICRIPEIVDVRHRSGHRAVLLYRDDEIDVQVAATAEYGSVLFRSTGTRQHVSAVTQRLARPGPWEREEQVYAQSGLQFVSAELREGRDEIDAAAKGTIPILVAREHIRGDLHMHTEYSDGRDTTAQMVQACHALGYAYIAITDHSERSAASRTLSRSLIARQRDEILALREQHPAMTIFHGVEVDIMADGRLDFSDAILAEFDVVLASLHDSAGHSGDRLTRRCIDAMRHPLVNVITHPSNRLVGHRDGYPLDYDAIYAAAVETGTALEIDGAPSHLDLDGALAREAARAGVTFVIDSDCHRASLLERQMRLGVGTARRGWVEPRHVLNCRPVEAVRAFIRQKRGEPPGGC
jgi:DNA polymerase (family X)